MLAQQTGVSEMPVYYYHFVQQFILSCLFFRVYTPCSRVDTNEEGASI
jgi:hypothetical protein